MNPNEEAPAEPTDGAAAPASSTSLTAEELRVLACLIEKANTTPDQYPLSTNALTTACNQKTSRDPVVDYSAAQVDRVLQLLRDGGWARSIRGAGNRTFKHKHVVDELLGLDEPQQALLAVLALRGPQSPGELKTRTERYHPFADLVDVEQVLAELAARQPALVRDIGRGPGQSQNRWVQLLGPTGHVATDLEPTADRVQPAPLAAPGAVPAATDRARPGAGAGSEVAELRVRVEHLEARLAELERELGLDD